MAGQSIVSGGPGIAYVTLDYADAARRLVEHLTANGYRRIALVGPVNTLVGAQFVAGCRAGLKGADPSAGSASQDSDPVTGANAHQPLIATCANDVTGAQLAALLLMNHPTMKPDALICLSDDIALGACQAARDLEAAIPDAVAVASFGAAAHTAELSPSLTTVAAPYHDLGVTAARLVLNREPATTTATTTTQVTLPVEVILRESTMRSPTD
jgi:LacI family transcriptional regulator